ncbi:MAG TPA: hypothetical protein PK198_04350 [Saprospiraceae bacterium]|nr:hypothetical protein [Saprospiraceae bacterium]HRK82635.1 hypothetical protein [Saprospiraceae bacterium]
MNTQEGIKLSSNWTNVRLYVSCALALLMIPVMILVTQEQEFHIGMLIGGIIFLVFTGFVIYQFIYVCDARVVGGKVVLRKKFRPAKTYSFDKIGYPTSFQLKSIKYTTVEMKNDDNTTEKYLIISSKSFLSFENNDAEHILLSLRDMAKNNNKSPFS